MGTFLRLSFVCLALADVACGATAAQPPTEDAGQDAAVGPMADTGSAHDAALRDDTGPSHDASDAQPSTADAGTITLQAFGGGSGEVGAQVPLDEPGVGPEESCTAPVQAGACQFVSCTFGGIGSPGGGFGDFGPLSATVGATTVPITYSGIGYPTVYFPSSVTLGAGGTMTFRGGDGVTVPKFDVTATIPGLAVITSPVPAADGGATPLGTSQDLSVTWVPIAIGQITFGITAGPQARVGASIGCSFDGASGSGVVPSALLSSLKQAAGTIPAYAGLSSEVDTTTEVDGLTLVVQSFQNVPTSGREFNVTLE